MDIWNELSGSRRSDWGYPRHIPVSEILAYCQFFCISDETLRYEIFYFCNKLDSIYCAWASEKDEDKEEFIRAERLKLIELIED